MVKVIKKNLSDKLQTPVYGLNRADLSLAGQWNKEIYNLRYPVHNNERAVDQKGHIVYKKNAEIVTIYFTAQGNTISISPISCKLRTQIAFLQIKGGLTKALFMMIKNYKISTFLTESNRRQTFETILHHAIQALYNTQLYNYHKFYKFGIN